MLGSNSRASNIVNLKRGRKLSLSLDHEATAACINRAVCAPNTQDAAEKDGIPPRPAAKKVAANPSDSCESSPCNVNLASLQAC
jgi:hypothetical protein